MQIYDLCRTSACTQTPKSLCNLNQCSGKEDASAILTENDSHLFTFFAILVVTSDSSLLQALISEHFNLAAVNFAIIFSSTTLPLSPPLSAPET